MSYEIRVASRFGTENQVLGAWLLLDTNSNTVVMRWRLMLDNGSWRSSKTLGIDKCFIIN